MRIVQVLAGAGEGGLERHVVTLARRLAQRHEVILLADPSFAAQCPAPLTLRPLPLQCSRLNPLVLWELRRTLQQLEPDVIHAHANKAAAMVSCIRHGLPGCRVATVHGLKKNTRMYARFDAVIAVSQGIAANVRHPRVRVVYNGIEPLPVVTAEEGQALRQNLQLPATLPVVAAVGRLAHVKGFDLLLRAWQGLEATLLIVGEGPERQRLETLAKQLGLGERVRLLGHRADVSMILQLADAVVISSRREGFPLVLAEALQARRVVVATAVPGVREILPPSQLVPPEDPAALQALLRTTLLDLDGARQACASAWQFAQTELTIDRMVAHVEAVYQECRPA